MQVTPKKLHESPEQGIRILDAGTYYAAKDVHFPRHRHTSWELVYYRTGAPGCVMDAGTRTGHPGLAWLTPPGIFHAERAVTAYSCHYIGLDLNRSGAWPLFLEDDADRSLGHTCRQLAIEWARKTPERERMIELLAAQLTVQLDRLTREPVLSLPAQTVARAERLIEENSARPLKIGDLARGVHVSSSALRGYFHATRGCSPREHLQQVRLEKAVRFLRTSTLTLEAIADLCGYDSASHLTRCVKKFTGRTPGKIRQQPAVVLSARR